MKTTTLTLFLFFWTALGFSQDSLYFLCKNKITLDSTKWKIISIDGGDSIILEKKLYIIPTENQVTIKIEENGVEKNKIFRVIKSPYPSIEVSLNNKYITQIKKLPTSGTDYKVKAIPDKIFAINYPNECRYKVTDFKVEILRNGILVDINDRKPNDTLRITVNKIERINFRNQKENIDIQKVYTFTLY